MTANPLNTMVIRRGMNTVRRLEKAPQIEFVRIRSPAEEDQRTVVRSRDRVVGRTSAVLGLCFQNDVPGRIFQEGFPEDVAS
jgi:hypothetical protein